MVMWLDDCDFAAAIETLTGKGRERNGGAPAPISRRKEADDPAERLRYVAGIWNAAGPIAGPPGAAYLASRGIVLDDVPDHGGLRFHPRCPWESGIAPCILSRFTDVITGEPRGIHRRPITGAKPKALGRIGGAVIRLWPDAEVTNGLVLGRFAARTFWMPCDRPRPGSRQTRRRGKSRDLHLASHRLMNKRAAAGDGPK